MMKRALGVLLAISVVPNQASALNILLSNDDGLTPNIIALHDALVGKGHDVAVSVPCTGQSGMGAAGYFLRPIETLAATCLNNAAEKGAPGAGPVSKMLEGKEFSDYFYVMGTPVMATAYGLDVVALQRWGKAPDLVISGPNVGQNAGPLVIMSGTLGNAQFALSRGIPAIAVSAGENTKGTKDAEGNIVGDPLSAVVAERTVAFVETLKKSTNNGPLLPKGVALNVNFPDQFDAKTEFKATKIGDLPYYYVGFEPDISKTEVAASSGLTEAHLPALTIYTIKLEPTEEQKDDEAYVVRKYISVSPFEFGYRADPDTVAWAKTLFGK